MSIWGVPIEVADRVNTIAWVAAMVGAAITLLSLMALFWASAIRDQNATLRITAAQKLGAEANERAEIAHLETTKAQLALEKLRSQFAGRRLTEERAQQLVAALSQIRAQVPDVIFRRLGDMEANVFATDLIEAFARAGIHVQVNEVGVFAPPQYGLVVIDGPDGPVRHVLAAVGISAQTRAGVVGTPQILVNLKPPPF